MTHVVQRSSVPTHSFVSSCGQDAKGFQQQQMYPKTNVWMYKNVFSVCSAAMKQYRGLEYVSYKEFWSN